MRRRWGRVPAEAIYHLVAAIIVGLVLLAMLLALL